MTSVRDTLVDPARLQEIVDLDLADEDLGPELGELAAEASARLRTPMALVSIVLDEAQSFAGQHGVPDDLAALGGSPVEWSYCQHTVHRSAPFAVEETTGHALVGDTPHTTRHGVRCYLGVPLVTGAGHAVGTICVLGTEPRPWTDADLDVLEELAERVVVHLEARRPAVSR
jgi:GAF domain-containing protein